ATAADAAGAGAAGGDVKDAKSAAVVVDPKKPPPLGTLFWCDRKAAAAAADAAQRRADASVGSVEFDAVTDLFFGKRIQIFVRCPAPLCCDSNSRGLVSA